MYIHFMDPKVTMPTECRTSHNIYNTQVSRIKNNNLQQTINSADRKCHLGHLLTSNGFISMTKRGLPITP